MGLLQIYSNEKMGNLRDLNPNVSIFKSSLVCKGYQQTAKSHLQVNSKPFEDQRKCFTFEEIGLSELDDKQRINIYRCNVWMNDIVVTGHWLLEAFGLISAATLFL